MKIIADLHVHSKHARATSYRLSIDNLEKYGKIKGLGLIGTGDFQHPLYRREIDEKLVEDDKGILRTENGFPFLWQTEISLMYSQNGKRRAVHLVVLSPNKKTSDKITSYLASKGRLDYDGRPIFGISAKDFVKDLKEISDDIEIIPAHVMTPWFGLFGSKSGFDSLEECFQEERKHIYAVESGMSADPPMLWRFKEKFNVVSFSDAHSFWPWRIGRESTIFEIPKLSYKNIIRVIRSGEGLATIETPPAYGRYHWDGHRNCGFSCPPEETKKLSGVCPKCGRPLIIGVDYRVEEIAVHPSDFKPENAKEFYEILPLHELISLNFATPLGSQKSAGIYDVLINKFENEFNILLNVSKEDLLKGEVDEKLAELILLNRENKLKIKPGYDGVYGSVQLPEKQARLF